MDTKRKTQAEIEGIWNVSLKKDSRGHATRQKAERGHNEDIGYRQRYHWTPANPMANVFWDMWLVCQLKDLRYDTRCYFNVRSKANMSQLNLPHGTVELKSVKTEKLKVENRYAQK